MSEKPDWQREAEQIIAELVGSRRSFAVRHVNQRLAEAGFQVRIGQQRCDRIVRSLQWGRLAKERGSAQ